MTALKGSAALPGEYEVGSFADRVQKQVIVARKNSEWRRQYMDWKMALRHERNLGRVEGIEKGKSLGILINRIDMVTNKVKRGMDLSAIADAMETDEETIRPIWEAVRAAGSDYDQEKILQKILGERDQDNQ